MSFEFLSPAASALSRSPMERQAQAAGARIELRDGWNVAVEFDGTDAERERCRSSVGFADVSHLGKVEVQGWPEPFALGRATRTGGAWWCPYTPERAIVICEMQALPELRRRLEDEPGAGSVVDVTTVWGALVIAGPLAPEVFARFTAIDLRPQVTPTRGFRPGSVARTPGAILREDELRWLMLFGSALGQYMWTVVEDAAESLGGGPVGVDALAPLGAPVADEEEAPTRA